MTDHERDRRLDAVVAAATLSDARVAALDLDGADLQLREAIMNADAVTRPATTRPVPAVRRRWSPGALPGVLPRGLPGGLSGAVAAVVALAGLGVSVLLVGAGRPPLPPLDLAAAGTPLPLERFESPEADPAMANRRNRLIGECMARAGFAWFPPPAEPAEPARPGSPQYRSGQGYGLDLDPGMEPLEDPVRPFDPNLAYRDRLDPDRRRAYDLALSGDWGEGQGAVINDPEGRAVGRVFPDSCIGWADSTVFGSQEARMEADIALVDARVRLYARVAGDPRLRDAERAWSGCVARAGYDFARPADMVGSLFDRSLAGEDVDAAERELADVDHACRVDTGYARVEEAVRRAHQNLFVAEHRALLEQFRDGTVPGEPAPASTGPTTDLGEAPGTGQPGE